MSDEPKLAPCPFCGSEAEIIYIQHGDNAGGSCVCCTRCSASSNVEFGRKENFVSNWNRRVPAPAVPDDVAIAALRLSAIVEGITGAMRHGTWRDERGVRLKDTPEWVALYNALNAANRAAISRAALNPTGDSA